MDNFQVHAWLIECISNLHVGSGDNNYGVIDKQVQRDSVTGYPVIHASGLKGALREYFKQNEEGGIDLVHVFGSSVKGEDGGERDMLQGRFRFFEADLLILPVRAVDNEVFYRATASDILNNLQAQSDKLKAGLTLQGFQEGAEEKKFEQGTSKRYIGQNSIFGDKSVELTREQFKEAIRNLPVVARNSLDNGQSTNLWYEEIVPRQSRFVCFIAAPTENQEVNFTDEKKYETFKNLLDGAVVQVGGNASVGYGYCHFTQIS